MCSYLNKLIAWLLVACLTYNPVYVVYTMTGLIFFTPFPAFADAFLDQAINGQNLGNSLLKDYSAPVVDPITGTMSLTNGKVAGQTVQQNELFQEIQPGSMDGIAASYGDDVAFGNHVNNGIGELTSGTSTYAKAYQTLLGANTSMPDISRDPIWTASDDVFTLKSPLISDLFSGCTKTTNYSQASCSVHVPELKTCKKTLGTQSCTVTRHLADARNNEKNIQFISSADPPQLPSHINDIIFSNVLDTVNLTIGIPWDYDPGSSGCYFWDWTMNIAVTDPTKIRSALLTHVVGDGGITVIIDGKTVWSNGNGACVHDAWSMDPNLSILPYLTAGSHNITVRITSDDNRTKTVPDGGTHFVIKQIPDFIETITDFPAGCRQRLFATWPPTDTAPQPWVSSGSINDQASNEWWQCTDASNSRTFGSITVTPGTFGQYLTPILPNPPPSPPAPICYRAETRLPGSISLPCFTDLNGFVQCPKPTFNNSAHTSCDPIASNPNCAWIGEKCAEGAISPVTGTCAEFIETYDCGTTKPGQCGQANTGEQTICGSGIRCMGGECVDQATESNQDFIRAATALQLLNQVQQSNGCDAAKGDCSLFNGEPMECQMADLSVLGSVDCCNMPIQGSWIQYMQLALNSWELADASVEEYALEQFGMEATNAQGAWHLVTADTVFNTPFTTVAETWTKITEPFTSMYDSVVSEFSADILSTAGIADLQAQAMQWMSTWVVENFGAQAGEAMFSYSVAPVTDAAGNVLQEGAATGMSEMLASIINVVGIIYAIYQIAKMVVQLIFACTEEEAKLNMLKEQKLCTNAGEIGDYCSASFLFGCIARKEAYCCFSSPFARIFQQQARPQLGINFGPPKTPSCEGLSVKQISTLDFDKMDFSEWINMLKGANQLPIDAAAANTMFSVGEVTTSNVPGATRQNAQDKLNKQTDGSNIDDIRQYLLNNL